MITQIRRVHSQGNFIVIAEESLDGILTGNFKEKTLTVTLKNAKQHLQGKRSG